MRHVQSLSSTKATGASFYGGQITDTVISEMVTKVGRWDHDRFFYNRSVNNVNVVNIHNVYNTTIVNRSIRMSYDGGNGEVGRSRRHAMRDRHLAPVAARRQHASCSSRPRAASMSKTSPPAITASPKPGVAQRGVAQARETGAANVPNPNSAVHRAISASAGNAGSSGRASLHGTACHSQYPQPGTFDRPKYQQQQEKLVTKQNQEHQEGFSRGTGTSANGSSECQ